MVLLSSCVFVVLWPCRLRCAPDLDFCSTMCCTSRTILHRGLQIDAPCPAKKRTPVTLLRRYEGVAKKRLGGWVVVGMVFICQHGLRRTTLHRICNKLGREIILTAQKHSGRSGFHEASPAIVPPSLWFSVSLAQKRTCQYIWQKEV